MVKKRAADAGIKKYEDLVVLFEAQVVPLEPVVAIVPLPKAVSY